MNRWMTSWEQLLRDDLRGTLIALAAIGVLTVLELAVPADREQTWRGRLRNLGFLVQFKLLGLAGVAAWFNWGPELRGPRLQPEPVVAALLVVANLIAIDVLYYWYHRAQHRFPALWALHELHHADAELNATSSYRTYWLEAPVQVALIGTPTILLFGGLGPRHGVAILSASLFFLIFSHSNLRLRLGPLSGWIIGPQVHRIHHSRLPEHQDRNFAQFFPFIDRVFGTFFPPRHDEFPPTGTTGLASDAPYTTAMVRPVKIWTRRA